MAKTNRTRTKLTESYAIYWKTNFPELTDKECEEKAKQYRKSAVPTCIEYYQLRYPDLSVDEQEKLRQLQLKRRRENNKSKLDYYIKHYPELTTKEQEDMWHKYNREHNYQCIEYYERLYPNATHDEHEQMLAEKIKGYLTKRPDNSGENNPNHKSKTTLQHRKESSPNCIEFYKKRYPDLTSQEQANLLQEHRDKNRIIVKNTIKDTNIQYYLNQGMSEDDAKFALKERQSTGRLDRYIKKYGESEGKRMFNERQEKWKAKLQKHFKEHGDGRSKQSMFATDYIDEIYLYFNLDKPKHEKYMTDILTDDNYAYDLCIGHAIIEFQGDYWHCNPNKYDGDYFNKAKRKYAKEIWDYDLLKKQCAERYNYKVLYIWEEESNKNGFDETLKKCINFIKENI